MLRRPTGVRLRGALVFSSRALLGSSRQKGFDSQGLGRIARRQRDAVGAIVALWQTIVEVIVVAFIADIDMASCTESGGRVESAGHDRNVRIVGWLPEQIGAAHTAEAALRMHG
jgi:hypothetical protein